jgi:hypothetical protein
MCNLIVTLCDNTVLSLLENCGCAGPKARVNGSGVRGLAERCPLHCTTYYIVHLASHFSPLHLHAMAYRGAGPTN